jgi:hypothetical protein
MEEEAEYSPIRKVLHYLISTALVLFAFGVQTGLSRWRHCSRASSSSAAQPGGGPKAWRALDVRLVMSATFALVLCLLKQAGDALSLSWLPWCQLFAGFGYCHFEWLDLFLTVDGILTGLLLLIGLHMCSNRCYKNAVPDLPCHPTVALSIDEGGDLGESIRDGDVFDLTICEAEEECDNESEDLADSENDFTPGHSLAASDDEMPSLTSESRRQATEDAEVNSMFVTLSSSPSSSPTRPLIFPSDSITV